MTALLLLLGSAACQTAPVALKPAPTVVAKFETDPVESLDDAADDPAIWRNAADPAKSLIIGTDKKAGIHVYNLRGRPLSFTPSPRLNNVDLRDLAGGSSIIVAASDREDVANARIALFRLDTAAARLVPLGSLPVGPGEAYGMCLWKRASDGALFGFLVLKDGRIDQVLIDLESAGIPRVAVVRSMKLATQSEGCVADDRTGLLYVAEEDVGIWRFEADPGASKEPVALAKVDGETLFADVEGLALAPAGTGGGHLLVSSQGDNAFALFSLPEATYVGRFRIAPGTVDEVSETDGIEVMLGNHGPDFPEGLLVVQDGDNVPSPQNFKLIDWRVVDRLF